MKQTVGVILAAGLGTRLRPSTDRYPKPLIPVGGIEPLFFALAKCQDLGLRRVVVNTHYLPEKIEQALERWRPRFGRLEIRCVREETEILGTGGALINIVQKACADWFKNNDTGILVQNGDTFAEIDLGRLLADPAQSSFALSQRPEHLAKYNPLWVDGQSREWVGIGKSAPQPGAEAAHFLGGQYLSPAAVNALKDDTQFEAKSSDLFNAIYRPLVNQGQSFRGVSFFETGFHRADEFWFDMTTREYLLEAQRHVLSTLSVSSSVWARLLERRYPSIKEIEPGIWVRCSDQERGRISFRSPAVLVDSLRAPNPGEGLACRQITLGPDASFICESSAVLATAPQEHDSEFVADISNSVVFAEERLEKQLPCQVKDDICILS